MRNKQAIIKKFGSALEIKILETEIPQPMPSEALIRIEASTISSTDVTIRKGLYPLLKDKPPITLGYDFVGVIEKLGNAVTEFKIGDRVAEVCQTGGNSNYICRDTNGLLRVDKSVEAIAIAPLILSGMTAFQIFKYAARVKGGETFLVQGGSGAVGNILLQLCKMNNVKIVSTSSKNKLPFLESLGADTVDYNANNYFELLKNRSGYGFDAAIDFSNQKSINNSFRLLKTGGRMILCGLLTTQRKMETNTFFNFLKFSLEFGGMMMKKTYWNKFSDKSVIFFGVIDSKKDFPERYQNDLNELVELVKTKTLKPHIHQVLTLDETANGHQLIDDAKSTGHLVIYNT